MTKRVFAVDTAQLKNGTAAAWTSKNPVLAKGEIGLETDTKKIKIGNGVTAWASLAYITAGNVANGLNISEPGGQTQTYNGAAAVSVTANNQLRRNTAYAVGDIAYSSKLKSYQYLQCTTAGTTAATEPDLTSLSVGGGT